VIAPFLKRAIPESVWRAPALPGRASGHRRRPRPLGAGLGDQERERSGASPCCRPRPRWTPAGVGEPHLPDARRRARAASTATRSPRPRGGRAGSRRPCRARRLHATPRRPGQSGVRGTERALMRQADRRIDWARDDTATVLRKLHAADGFPGVAGRARRHGCWLFNAHADTTLHAQLRRRRARRAHRPPPRRRGPGHARRRGVDRPRQAPCRGPAPTFKLPVAQALPELAAGLPEWRCRRCRLARGRHLAGHRYEEAGPAGEVGFLHFDFYNGAMSTAGCRRLREAFVAAAARPRAASC
jgi:putative two-component system hydrogenase maturation factor HypX/HoxX